MRPSWLLGECRSNIQHKTTLRCFSNQVWLTWQLAGQPAQADFRWATAQCSDWRRGVPTPSQGVLDGEVVRVLLQRVIQRCHRSILPEFIQHQRGENLGKAGNPETGSEIINDRNRTPFYLKTNPLLPEDTNPSHLYTAYLFMCTLLTCTPCSHQVPLRMGHWCSSCQSVRSREQSHLKAPRLKWQVSWWSWCWTWG